MTNLEKIKDIALTFSHLEIKKTDIEFIVLHPFTEYVFANVPNQGMINILENDENHEKFMGICRARIARADSYLCFSSIITKPYRSAFFKYTNQYASDKDAAEFLKDFWISTETVNVDANISRLQYVKYFKKYDKEFLMTKEELDVYNALEDEIIIYRGINNSSNHPIDGMCWTPNISIAEFFAERFDKGGTIYKATIDKDYILAYFEHEKETVVDFRKLKSISKYKEY